MTSQSPAKPAAGHESVASSAGLSLNLSSNNPFRNRAASPPSGGDSAFASPTSPFDDPPPARPVSRNPFIDQPPPPLRSPGAMSTNSDPKSLSAEDIFDSLTLDDKTASQSKARSPPTQRPPQDGKPRPRRGDMPPPPGARRKPGPPDSRSPQRKSQSQRRPRRNSETSVADFDARPITQEELKMIQERRQERDRQKREREREASKTGKAGESTQSTEVGEGDKKRSRREGRSKDKSGRPSRKLDIIDQLDATSIYGTGLFHHDGPFDALNPHRNRNTSRRAPMQAFPKDSLNNSIGGAGPLNPNPDHSQFMGTAQPEAFRDYASGGRIKNGYSYQDGSRDDGLIFDPVARGNMVHGDESYGLGTSTFLEGTPAAKTAIERHQAEQQRAAVDGGLQRKKSLAQRIRHINKGPRDFGPSGRLTNPEVYSKRSPDASAPADAGSEANPFFSEFNKGEDSITVKPRDGALSPISPPMERRGSGPALERRATTDATPNEEAPPKPSGILGRMKSLKAPKKPKNTDIASSSQAPAPAPGTAV